MSKRIHDLKYLSTGFKKCKECKLEKPTSEFYKRGGKEGDKGVLRSFCKECYHLKVYNKSTSKDKRDKYVKRKKDRQIKEKELDRYVKVSPYKTRDKAKLRDYALRTKYGITLDQYTEMVELQDGKCYVCEKIPTKMNRMLCVDHDHETGVARKLLCDRCNLILGMVKDDIEVLRSLIKYLKEHKGK